MKHVIAFDVSMGKSYMVIYSALKKCIFQAELNHSRPDFESLKDKINDLTEGYGNSRTLFLSQLESIPGNWNGS